jgi:glycosyltransferase involved in cell wall biosynthesis
VKVLLPLHRFNAAGIGTVVRGLSENVPAQLRSGERLLVIGQKTDLAVRRNNVELLDTQQPTETALGRFVYEQGRLLQASRQADLVHLTDYRPLLLSRTPFILTIHDVFFLDYPAWYPPTVSAFKRMMFAAALVKRPCMLVCDSEYTRSRLLHHAPRLAGGHVRVIHPGVSGSTRTERPVETDQRYFLTVSTIEPRKNHLMILEAMRRARRRGLRIRWKVVGAPGYRSERIVAALRGNPDVDVLGHVSEEELDGLYAGALFHATPSVAEGFGFPPLEAMARGVPVVASTGSAMDETVGPAAMRIAAWDVEGWAVALHELASDPTAREQLARAGSEVAGRFSWARAAAAYADSYRDALDRDRR